MSKRLLWTTERMGRIGGSEHLIVSFSILLAQQGWSIQILSCDKPHRGWQNLIGQHPHVIRNRIQFSTHRSSEDLVRYVFRERSMWDVILVMPLEHSWGPSLLNASLGTPVIGLEPTDCSKQCWWLETVNSDFVERLDSLFVLTESASVAARQRWPGIKRIVVVPNTLAVDYGIQNEPTGRPLLVAISRLSPEKGLDYLLAAVALAMRNGYDISIDIWGEGPDRPRLKEQSYALGVGDIVSLRGTFCPGKGVHTVLRNYHAVVLPSLFEGLPVTLLEAAACGRAIVSTDTTGSSTLLGSDYPWLTPIGDTRALAEALVTCCQDYRQRRLLAQYTRKRFVESFSPHVVGPQLDSAILKSLLLS